MDDFDLTNATGEAIARIDFETRLLPLLGGAIAEYDSGAHLELELILSRLAALTELLTMPELGQITPGDRRALFDILNNVHPA